MHIRTIVTIFINTPSKGSPAWLKKREAWTSALVAANKIKATTRQKEKDFLAVQTFNSTRKRIQKKIKNSGLDIEKIKFVNSLKYTENLSPSVCQSMLLIPIAYLVFNFTTP
ncbi:MAG: hypothetical protein WC412_06645 [Candidatus Omnitrophota bacterium]|jgi:hypothetical protein